MLEQIQQVWPVSITFYSQSEWPERSNTLVIDTMGLLAHLYAYAHVVWVGGGFGAGIHNILEPAVYGKAIFFGPKYDRFPEAHELIRLGIAESCKYPSAFSNAVRALVKDRRRLAIIESKAEKYFADLPDTRALVWEVVGPYLLKNEDTQEAS
jgi:3-deoxy-D-manno-octulosonic-acid transferase